MAEDKARRNRRIREWQKENTSRVQMDKELATALRQAAARAGQTISEYIRDKIIRSD
jgi:type II secretory pathway component PulC